MIPRHLLLLEVALLCSCEVARLRPIPPGAEAPPPAWKTIPDLLLLADLQHHVAYEEIALPGIFRFFRINQAHLEKHASGFYRHAARSRFVPEALAWTIRQAAAKKIRFGILAGDLADLGCVAELDALFAVLRRGRSLRFIIVPGNHDVAPQGVLSPRSHLEPWRAACADHGGILTKAVFVERVLAYYRDAWGFDLPPQAGPPIHRQRALEVPPRFEPIRAQLRDGELHASFTASYRTAHDPTNGEPADACAHKEAYLFQRFHLRHGEREVVITAVDSTDYAGSKIMSTASTALFLHLGLAGGVSPAQVAWLRALPRPPGAHLVVSHFVPFDAVAQEPERLCPRGGTDCITSNFGANYVTRAARESGIAGYALDPGGQATLVYAHTHEPLLLGRLEDKRRGSIPTVRLPSLIDNAAAVTLESGRVDTLQLPRSPRLRLLDGSPRYLAWLYKDGDICRARAKEHWDLARNLRAFTHGRCATANLDAILEEATRPCRTRATDWAKHLRARTQFLVESCFSPHSEESISFGAALLASPKAEP